MGLDTSHDCWHGAYSAFNRWREKIAELAGLPPLNLMDGHYEGPAKIGLPIKWACLKPSPLRILLDHSDCDGEIAWKDCAPIADELEKLLPLFPDGGGGGHIEDWKDCTSRFIAGLRKASAAKENVLFH